MYRCVCLNVCTSSALRSHILHFNNFPSPVSSRTSPLFPRLDLKGWEGAGNVPRTINHLLFCELLRFLLGVVMAHWGSGWGSAHGNLSIDSVTEDVQATTVQDERLQNRDRNRI